MIFHWKSRPFSFLKISAMMSWGRLWDLIPRCHLERLNARAIREELGTLDIGGMDSIWRYTNSVWLWAWGDSIRCHRDSLDTIGHHGYGPDLEIVCIHCTVLGMGLIWRLCGTPWVWAQSAFTVLWVMGRQYAFTVWRCMHSLYYGYGQTVRIYCMCMHWVWDSTHSLH